MGEPAWKVDYVALVVRWRGVEGWQEGREGRWKAEKVDGQRVWLKNS